MEIKIGEYKLEAPCACGNGTVKTNLICVINEENQLIYKKEYEEICCANCKNKYHIETLLHPTLFFDNCLHYQTFLVPNGLSLIFPPEKRKFNFNFYETVVARFSYDEITELMHNISKCSSSTELSAREYEIASLHKKENKSIALKNILNSLQVCLDTYHQHEFTKEEYEKFIKMENDNIAEMKNTLFENISKSHAINYGINPFYEQQITNKTNVIYV